MKCTACAVKRVHCSQRESKVRDARQIYTPLYLLNTLTLFELLFWPELTTTYWIQSEMRFSPTWWLWRGTLSCVTDLAHSTNTDSAHRLVLRSEVNVRREQCPIIKTSWPSRPRSACSKSIAKNTWRPRRRSAKLKMTWVVCYHFSITVFSQLRLRPFDNLSKCENYFFGGQIMRGRVFHIQYKSVWIAWLLGNIEW